TRAVSSRTGRARGCWSGRSGVSRGHREIFPYGPGAAEIMYRGQQIDDAHADEAVSQPLRVSDTRLEAIADHSDDERSETEPYQGLDEQHERCGHGTHAKRRETLGHGEGRPEEHRAKGLHHDEGRDDEPEA